MQKKPALNSGNELGKKSYFFRLKHKAFFSCRNFRACSKKKCEKRCRVFRARLLLQRMTKNLAMKIYFFLLIVTIPLFFPFSIFSFNNLHCETAMMSHSSLVPNSTPPLASYALLAAKRLPSRSCHVVALLSKYGAS